MVEGAPEPEEESVFYSRSKFKIKNFGSKNDGGAKAYTSRDWDRSAAICQSGALGAKAVRRDVNAVPGAGNKQ